MRIYLRVSCAGFSIDRINAETEAPDGSSVYQILAVHAGEHDAGVIAARVSELVILVNGSPARLSQRLNDGDRLDVLRVLSGG